MNAEILKFLRELQQNNNRTWFNEKKPYCDLLRNHFAESVQEIIKRLSTLDHELSGLDAKNCLFRLYRDIRFSPNKLPYKTHFAAYISKGGRKSEYAGYYLHLEPGNCSLSGGIWMPQPKLLKMLRKDIYSQAEEFVSIMGKPGFRKHYGTLRGEELTRMPEGFPADSPYGYILKHKDFCVTSPKTDSFMKHDGWIEKVVAGFAELIPFNRFLNYTVNEYLGEL